VKERERERRRRRFDRKEKGQIMSSFQTDMGRQYIYRKWSKKQLVRENGKANW